MSKLVVERTPLMAALLLQLAGIAFFALSSVDGAKIDIINQCTQTVTACATCCGGAKVSCYVLNAGGSRQQIDVGKSWTAGVIWAFPGNSGSSSVGNTAKPQANLAELTIGANGVDYYDISNVDAYNMRMKIAPTAGGGGSNCKSITCDISDITSFCKSPNKLTGAPGNGCKNTNGPGLVATAGTKAFKDRCPTSYSYSKDDAGTVFGCNTGMNYQVVFCP